MDRQSRYLLTSRLQDLPASSRQTSPASVLLRKAGSVPVTIAEALHLDIINPARSILRLTGNHR